MSLFGFSKKKVSEAKEIKYSDRGILVFENTSEVIRAERILKNKRMRNPAHGATTRSPYWL